MQRNELSDIQAIFSRQDGAESRASVVHLERHQAVFEVYSAQEALRKSEVLEPFTILLRNRPVYTGSAVIKEVVSTGLLLLCQVRLGDDWRDLDFAAVSANGSYGGQFEEFITSWEQRYKIRQQFKVVIADIQSFLAELRSWLQQVELGLRGQPGGDRLEAEEQVLRQLEEPGVAYLTQLFERFEQECAEIPLELRPAHDAFACQQLNSLILTAPFAFRTFHKPMGYAGDYEMVNMMLRSPFEGSSLFAKLFNCWLLRQAPAEAHRNRITFLEQRIREETARLVASGRNARILSLGCGPAVEIQHLLKNWPATARAEFVLLDFNEETLNHARSVLTDIGRKHGCQPAFTFIRRSVQQILKEAHKGSVWPREQAFDLVYCAGLFDYLSEPMCQRLASVAYEWLAPGGLTIFTNIAPLNPFRNCMETFLDWQLTYRGQAEMTRLYPTGSLPDWRSIKSDLTGVNIFGEARKPNHVDRSTTQRPRP